MRDLSLIPTEHPASRPGIPRAFGDYYEDENEADYDDDDDDDQDEGESEDVTCSQRESRASSMLVEWCCGW